MTAAFKYTAKLIEYALASEHPEWFYDTIAATIETNSTLQLITPDEEEALWEEAAYI